MVENAHHKREHLKRPLYFLVVKVKKSHSLILSGGLKEENITEAIARVSPQVVDINSGIESAPGKKDHVKLRNIIEIIRNIDDINCRSREACPRAGGERKSGIFKNSSDLSQSKMPF